MDSKYPILPKIPSSDQHSLLSSHLVQRDPLTPLIREVYPPAGLSLPPAVTCQLPALFFHSQSVSSVREEALKLWIASSASTVGVTTFLGVLEGGAMHYFVSKRGGADKKCGGFQKTHRYFYRPTYIFVLSS